MDIIIDASCIIAVLVNEPERELVFERTVDTNLFSPACLPYEIGNALSAMVKRNKIDTEQAVSAIKEYEMFPIQLIEPDIAEAVKIASEERHYAYDVYYITCAIAMRMPLFSLDRGLIKIAEKRGVKCL